MATKTAKAPAGTQTMLEMNQARLQRKWDKLQAERDELTQDIASLHLCLSQLNEMKPDGEMKQEVLQYAVSGRILMGKLQTKSDALEDQVVVLEVEINDPAPTEAELRAKLVPIMKERGRLAGQVKQAQVSVLELEEELADLEVKIEECQNKDDEDRDEDEYLEERLDLEEEIERAKRKAKELRKKLDEVRQDERELKDVLKACQ